MMLCVNEECFDGGYFEDCFASFEAHPVLTQARQLRLAVRLSDSALWLALCLYIKSHGGTVFPLPAGAPIEAARRWAKLGRCSHLVFGSVEDSGLDRIECVDLGEEEAAATAFGGLVQMSSGTTGEPKIIERRWESIDVEVDAYIRHFPEADEWTPIVACPVTHSYGLISGVLVALSRRRKPVIIDNLNPKYVLRKASEVASPVVYSSPTLISTLMMLVPEVSPIHAVVSSGTLMQEAWFERTRSRVRHLCQQYGCSEAGCISFGLDVRSASDVGSPLPHIDVQAGTDATAPGEVVVQFPGGPVVTTGDLGFLRGGRLHFVSREDDMINVSGLNVYPKEVEDVVLRIPAVRDAVVFGRSHVLGHQQVCLHFVSDEAVTDGEIREWCARRLANHQVPMSISRVAEIPKLPSGKINRKALARP